MRFSNVGLKPQHSMGVLRILAGLDITSLHRGMPRPTRGTTLRMQQTYLNSIVRPEMQLRGRTTFAFQAYRPLSRGWIDLLTYMSYSVATERNIKH